MCTLQVKGDLCLYYSAMMSHARFFVQEGWIIDVHKVQSRFQVPLVSHAILVVMSRTFKKVDYDQALNLTVRLGDCLPASASGPLCGRQRGPA